jgi:hypothetical protein
MKKTPSEFAENASADAAAARYQRGSGTRLTIDFKGHPDLLKAIRAQAKADDREPSQYIRHLLARLDAEGQLIV